MDTPSTLPIFDWGRCIFCQNANPTMKTTCCPADSKSSDLGSGYKTLAEIVLGYHEIDKLPKKYLLIFGMKVMGLKALSKLIALFETFCMQLH